MENVLESNLGNKLVPNWKRFFDDTLKFSMQDEFSETEVVNEFDQCEEWMYIGRLIGSEERNDMSSSNDAGDIAVTSDFPSEQIAAMPSWLDNEKRSCLDSNINITEIDVTKFNIKQKLAYDIVANHFNLSEKEPLHLLVTGQGGSGKSFIINGLRQLLGNCCVVTSLFGIASHNINGVTLHSLLKLPIQSKNCCELKGSVLADMQMKMAHIRYLIIDEFSVIGQRTLEWIDRKLQQASGLKDEIFGGYSVILFGDFAQLPPVSDKPLYHTKPDNATSLMGYTAYMKFQDVVKLTVNQRVSDSSESRFRDLLVRVRNGESTISDWKLLCSRNVHFFDTSNLEYMPVRLAYTNEVVAKHNYNMLKKQDRQIITLKAVHSNSKAAKLSSDDFGGLEPVVNLALGSRVMLVRNLWVAKGLCNGAMGEVTDIVYGKNNRPPSLPVAVMVKFENYSGPKFMSSDSIPIVPIIANSFDGENNERQQIPLKLSWSITIHKSQGLTISQSIVDLGPSEKVAGIAYVALSRVKKLSDLMIEPLSLERLQAVRKTLNFQYRIVEENRLDNLDKLTQQKYAMLS